MHEYKKLFEIKAPKISLNITNAEGYEMRDVCHPHCESDSDFVTSHDTNFVEL